MFSYPPVKVGDTFTDARGEEIIKNLYATGFSTMRTGKPVIRCCSLAERLTISSINITGAKMLQSSVILQNFNSFGWGNRNRLTKRRHPSWPA